MFTGQRLRREQFDQLAVYTLDAPPQQFLLNKDTFTIGRDPECDIVVEHPRLSRIHLRLERDDEGLYQITDLDSTTGTRLGEERLIANEPSAWQIGEILRVGDLLMRIEPYQLPVEDADDHESQPTPDSVFALPSAPFDPEQEQIEAILIPPSITVTPGGRANLLLDIINKSKRSEHFTIEQSGLPDAWLETPLHTVHLEPTSSKLISLAVLPARLSEYATGMYQFTIIVRGLNVWQLHTSVQGQIELTGFHDFSLSLLPEQFEDGRFTTLTLSNRGNVMDSYKISISDVDGRLRGVPQVEAVHLTAGESKEVILTISAVQRKAFGEPEHAPFVVHVVSTQTGEQRSHQGMVVIKARYSASMIGLAILFVFACGWLTTITGAGLMTLFEQRTNAEATRTATRADVDGDGLTWEQESELGTDFESADTDGDGLNDGDEIAAGADPTVIDTDGDGLDDAQEVALGTNPREIDTDGDGLSDFVEDNAGSDPLARDTDGDGLDDASDLFPLIAADISQPEALVRFYYEQVGAGNYDITFPILTERFMRVEGVNEITYRAWWDRVANISIDNVELVTINNGVACVRADLKYTLVDGTVIYDPRPYINLVRDASDTRWLIDEKLAPWLHGF